MAKAKVKKTKQPMKQKVKSGTKKGGKRSFYEVSVPLTTSKIFLYSSGPEELEGKSVKLDLTKILRGKAFELKFNIKADGEHLSGEPKSLILAGSYVRRVMRRGTSYVEDSFKIDCKDAEILVKPFLITRNKVSRAVRRALRVQARKNLTTYFKPRSSVELFSEIMANKLQKQLSTLLRKVYPLALCEIRWIEVIKRK